MYRLLTLIALVFSAGCATDDMAGADQSAGTARIVRQVDLPMSSSGPAAQGQPSRRVFQAQSVQGSLYETGGWAVTTEVTHTRVRCATYETGIQIGRGDAACTRVDWLSDPDFRTWRTQCNSATLIHSGRGTVNLPESVVKDANCARVLVRCSGAC